MGSKVELHSPDNLLDPFDLISDIEIQTECLTCCMSVAHLSNLPPEFILPNFMAIYQKASLLFVFLNALLWSSFLGPVHKIGMVQWIPVWFLQFEL